LIFQPPRFASGISLTNIEKWKCSGFVLCKICIAIDYFLASALLLETSYQSCTFDSFSCTKSKSSGSFRQDGVGRMDTIVVLKNNHLNGSKQL